MVCLWPYYTFNMFRLMYNILTGDFDVFEENTKSRVPEKAYKK